VKKGFVVSGAGAPLEVAGCFMIKRLIAKRRKNVVANLNFMLF
jgi:hypothetical protein